MEKRTISIKEMFVSYDSTALINEIRADIEEFGEDKRCMIWTIIVEDTELITGYDISRDGRPIMSDEIKEGETLKQSTLGETLKQLEKQNKLF